MKLAPVRLSVGIGTVEAQTYLPRYEFAYRRLTIEGFVDGVFRLLQALGSSGGHFQVLRSGGGGHRRDFFFFPKKKLKAHKFLP